MGRAGLKKENGNGHARDDARRWCVGTKEGGVFLVYTERYEDAVTMVQKEGLGQPVTCAIVHSVEETFAQYPLPPDYWESHVRRASQGRKRR